VFLIADWTWQSDDGSISKRRATSADITFVLSTLEKVMIRGDAYTYGPTGYGQETTYLNNVRLLFSKTAVEQLAGIKLPPKEAN